jgi:PPOX class probable F420-dependent enzyme
MTPEQRHFVAAARVARMATVDDDGMPTVLPICFWLDGERLYQVMDEKPKRVGGAELKRVRNLRANPSMAVVVDRWDEDWARLGWVLLRGRGDVLEGGAEHARALAALRDKYEPYRTMALEHQLLIRMTVQSVRSWGALT